MSLPRPTTPRPTRTTVAGMRLLLTAVVIAVSLSIDLNALAVVALLFAIVVPFERLFPRHRQRLRRPAVATDLAYALSAPILQVLGTAGAILVSVLSLFWLPALVLRPAVEALPDGLRIALGILLFDLVSYWAHRFAHEIPAGWRFHKVHHSTEQLDWVSGFRGHPFDGLLLAPPIVFLLAAGFSAELSGVLAAVQFGLGLFLHANVRWRWRPLHRIVITPEFHHWHHSNEPDAHGTNYSVGLPLWDIIFGTYRVPADRRPRRYGIDEPMPTGMLAQLWEPLRDLPRPPAVARHPWRSTRLGWRWLRHTVAAMLAILAHPRRRRLGVVPTAGRAADAIQTAGVR